MKLRVAPLAEGDLQEAHAWYEYRRAGLGYEFLQEVDDCFRRIGANPVAFQVVRKPVRRALLSRFPYLVFFVLTKREIVIIACLHGHQNPARWKRRV